MQGLFRAAIAVLAGLLGFGLFALVQSGAATGDEVAATRQDGITLASDDDGDEDEDEDETPDGVTVTTGATTFDSVSGESQDGTGSGVTVVSVDNDVSVDDLTKDRTLDGGDPTRDFSENRTNDGTRNDTR